MRDAEAKVLRVEHKPDDCGTEWTTAWSDLTDDGPLTVETVHSCTMGLHGGYRATHKCRCGETWITAGRSAS